SLFQVIGFFGIALSTAAASWINVIMLSATLHRRGHLRLDRRLLGRLPRILAASALMGVALWLAAHALRTPCAAGLLAESAALVLLVGGGMLLFGVAALLLR